MQATYNRNIPFDPPTWRKLAAIAEQIAPTQGSWLADRVQNIQYASGTSYEEAFAVAEQCALDCPVWIAEQVGGWFMRTRLDPER